ncbi:MULTISPECIES: SulP family inorganic anion transporter [unclassified Colwellia]|jgi:SulP family sulfate permease|uniref:SulP family inorganic anion transporter n=1 Tax=unclassified Colwellia TaxID=196834 RepID=UPI0015F54493|nr:MULTISPECIES: SulP family inorganic anion transporter [unclassified Colwellia]MBA6349441.1 SulP family inorganic anion transporter [Colwellia sp. BRX8-9]MBA6357191.1 SulP family inorganic anion transporter [Colwellia sp. BRX8-3]MBA6360711.1 SulP family inorganic anion transporter [Colwellia sp. BRX8-6]MBA6368681.1 SulP family inorganic anion transporter [Colwellia sp. BRX8-5]MBA6375681.1 SulP family inorganic anion transporter [Colwellia sp. BRX8-2]|tara:strand:- start:753 stop:2282 length:1530 start_codon:yes stop_codon:yes gene_type:complete
MFELHASKVSNLKNDVLSGLTVALALVPEAVAFAFVAGVDPLVGLYAAFMVGLITSVFGGRPGMISGATGAMAVVMVSLVAIHGVEYLFATVVLTGLLQILAGIFKLGKFIRLVPHPVMLGFVNGLAIVIFLAQLGQFKFTNDAGELEWMQGAPLYTMAGLILLTMAIIHFFPKLTKAVPSTLVAIVAVSFLVFGLNLDTKLVGDVASIAGGLPTFSIPSVPFDLEMLKIIFPFAIVLAAIGLIESLLTLTLIDELTGTRGRGNQECIAQGAANTVTGFFGGMGGCAMIGQSMINVNSGGRGRASGITAALALLGFILFASGLIEQIPLAALVGVMFIVVIGTFEWSSFRILGKVPKADAFVIILVSGVTVYSDLAIAVVVGVIVSALVFAWEHAKHVTVHRSTNEHGSTVYDVKGPLFFGSVANFLEQFDMDEASSDIIVEFKNSRVVDHSAIEAIDTLADRYLSRGKTMHLRHLSSECTKLLTKAGSLVEINVIEDPDYHIATDKLD